MADKPPSKVRIDNSLLARVLTLGSLLVVLTCFGWWLDQKLHTAFLTYSGAGLGMLFCFLEAWRMSR